MKQKKDMKKMLRVLMVFVLSVVMPAWVHAQVSCPGSTLVTVTNSDEYDPEFFIQDCPFSTLYNYSYTELVIPAERLMGISEVKALQLKPVDTVGGTMLNNCQIYMANVSNVNFDDGFVQDAENFVLVFSGAISITDTSWKTVVFNQSSFVWDGESDILVAMVRNDGEYAESMVFACYAASGPYVRRYANDDDEIVVGQIDPMEGTSDYYVPLVRLIGCSGSGSGSSCLAVTNLQATNVNHNNFFLSWSDPNGSSYYSVYLNNQLYANSITSPNILVQNLTPNTSYSVKVYANCSATERSAATSISVTTPCGPLQVPFLADFEEVVNRQSDSYLPPECWTLVSGNVTERETSGDIAWDGIGYLDFRGSRYNMIAMPAKTGSYQGTMLHFYERSENTSRDCGVFSVGYITDPEDTLTFVALDTYSPHDGYEEHEVSLSSVPEGAMLAFVQHRCRSTYYWYMDQVEVQQEPSCFRVANPQAVATASSVLVSWSDTSSAALSYSILLSNADDHIYVSEITDTFYLFTELPSLTPYNVSIVSHCSDVDSSRAVTLETQTLSDGASFLSFDIQGDARRGQVFFDNASHEINAPVWYTDSLASHASFIWSVTLGSSVYIDTAGDQSFSCLVDTVTIGNYLVFNQPIVLRVRAQDTSIYEDYVLTLVTESCPAPRNLTLEPARSSVTVRWTEPDPEVDAFNIVISPEPLTSTQLSVSPDVVLVNGLEKTFTGLERESQYYVYLRATCASANDEWVSATVTTLGVNACQTVLVAQGNNSNGMAPVYGYYGDDINTHTQSVYPASMLVDAVGHSIESVHYNVVSGSSYDWGHSTWQMRMGITSLPHPGDEFIPSQALTLVYTGTLTATPDSGMTVTFDQPFAYEGGNLVIDFTVSDPYPNGFGDCNFSGVSLDSATRVNPANGDDHSVSFLPGFSFTYCNHEVLCPSVTEVAVDSVAYTSVRVHWTASEADYCVGYRLAPSVGAVDDPDVLPFVDVPADSLASTVTNLADNTDYILYVQALCNSVQHPDGVSDWSSVVFHTPYMPRYYSVEVEYDATMGTVTGEGTFLENTVDTLRATPREGFHFVRWSTGDTLPQLVITVTEDLFLTATFAVNPLPDTPHYQVTVLSGNIDMGGVMGGGVYDSASTVTVQANAYPGYHFVSWSNGVALNPYSFVVTRDTTLAATFAVDVVEPTRFHVTLEVNDATMGYVTGAGDYDSGSVVNITAVSHTGYRFLRWDNGVRRANASIELSSDTTITAIFEAVPPQPQDTVRYTVTAEVNNPMMGRVEGTGVYDSASTVRLTAIPTTGHRFVSWSNGNTSPVLSFVLRCDTSFTAVFAVDTTQPVPPARFRVTAMPNDVAMGIVRGAGEYDSGAVVTLSVVAAPNCRFVSWSNGDTTDTISFVLQCDTTFTAFFERLDAIDMVENGRVLLFVQGRTLHVQGAEGERMELFDLAGRRHAVRSAAKASETLEVPAPGVYLLRVGDAPARRVLLRD